MTEKQWLAGARFQPLHAHLCDTLRVQRTKSGRRKLRLFACACCRWIWRLLPDAPCRSAVETAESFAEGEAAKADLDAAFEAARPSMSGRRPNGPVFHAVCAALDAVRPEVLWASFAGCKASFAVSGMNSNNHRHACDLLRCVFGNPFRPMTVKPSWRAPTAVRLAQAAYDERILPEGHLDPARLGILSDSLEDAGCTDEAILSHLRSPGPHVRGCWAVDLILSKQ